MQGDRFDAVMNYLFTGATIAFAAKDRVHVAMTEGRNYHPYPALDAPGFARKIEDLLGIYDWEHTQVQMNLLDSHDTARMLTLADSDKASLRLATLFQMTYPGAPSIFYGDEIGIEGALDPASRRGMPWDRSQWDTDLFDYFKRAIKLRNEQPVLRHGRLTTIYAEGDVYAMARHDDSQALIVALNTGEQPAEVTLPVGDYVKNGESLTSVFGPELRTDVGDGMITITLPAREGVVLA
jgi:cyclomaltodextrinase / maltogenic alpha-amylase / neopullulanase